MKREVIATAKTVEDAIAKGVRELGAPEEDVNVEVLTQPKKGFLGIGEVPAQVKVTYEQDGADAALCFVRTIAREMGLEATVTIEKDPGEGEARISLIGDEAGTLIGYHGETLDALQYLATLTANKVQEESGERKYQKIVVDVENYRAKREETLRALARRMAQKAIKDKIGTVVDTTDMQKEILRDYEEDITKYAYGVDKARILNVYRKLAVF